MTRIAVIEDDPAISRTISDMLREAGFQTVEYFQPNSDTRQHLEAFGPDLVILDAIFHGPVSGWDIIDSLRKDGDGLSIPVVLCSAAAKQIEEHRPMLDRLGIPVLVKPFDMDTLERTVHQVLDLP